MEVEVEVEVEMEMDMGVKSGFWHVWHMSSPTAKPQTRDIDQAEQTVSRRPESELEPESRQG